MLPSIDRKLKTNLAPLRKKSQRIAEAEIASTPKFQIFFDEAGKLMNRKAYPQAIRMYNSCLQLNPKHSRTYCNLGAAYKMVQDYQAARKAYQDALLIDVNDTMALYNLSNLEKYLGNFDQAIKGYHRCLKSIQTKRTVNKIETKNSEMLDKLYFNSLVNTAVCFQSEKRYDEAIAVNDSIINSYPMCEQGHFNKAMCLMGKIYNRNMQVFKKARAQLCKIANEQFKNTLNINADNLRARIGIVQCSYITSQSQQGYKNGMQQLQSLKSTCKFDIDLRTIKSKIQYCTKKIKQLQQPNQSQIESNSSQLVQAQYYNKVQSKVYIHSRVLSQNDLNSFDGSPVADKRLTSFYESAQHIQIQAQQTQQFWELITKQEYMLAVKIAEKLPQSLQRFQKLIVSKFLLAWSTQSTQIYQKIIKIYELHILKQNFDTIKQKISQIGHQTMAFMLKISDNYSQAIKHYKYIIEVFVNSHPTLNKATSHKLQFFCQQLYECYHARVNKDAHEEAVFLQRLYANHPHEILLRYLEIFYIQSNQKHKSHFLIGQASELKSTDINLNILQAIAKQQTINYTECIKLVLDSIKQNHAKPKLPEQIMTQFLMGLANYFQACLHIKSQENQNIVQEASQIIDMTFVSSVSKEILCYSLGNAFYKQGKYSKACTFYRKILVNRSSVSERLGICLMAIGDYKQALSCFQFALSQDPQDNVKWVSFVVFNWVKGETCYDGQVEKYFRCIDCDIDLQKRAKYAVYLIKSLQLSHQDETIKITKQQAISKLVGFMKAKSCCLINNPRTIRVLTLNYSGVLTSPYQYFENQDIKENILSETFTQIVQKVYPQFRACKQKTFAWDMGSLDTKWKQRYSPFNQLMSGVNQATNMMMNEKQFADKWEQVHQRTRENIKKTYFSIKYKGDDIERRMKIQIQRCRLFDMFCYKAFIRSIYGIQNIQNINLSSEKYLQQRQIDFSKPYLDDEKKIIKTLLGLANLPHDIVFLQQANTKLMEAIKKADRYYITQMKNSDSKILMSKGSPYFSKPIDFVQENKIFLQKWAKFNNVSVEEAQASFNYNNDSVFQIFDDYFLLNVHISSNKDKNLDQMNIFKKQVCKLMTLMPEYKLILGGDFNSEFNLNYQEENRKGKLYLNYYPNQPTARTVKKKRTMMQPQRNKAEKLDESPKDYLITNLNIVESKNCQVDGEDVGNHIPLLPNENHPYDHFIIYATLEDS